jgi:hypothetical protein
MAPGSPVGPLDSNRAFTLDVPDLSYDDKLRNPSDAVSFFTWKESFDLRGFADGELWKKAIFEGWGTSMLVWLTGLATYSLAPTVPQVYYLCCGYITTHDLTNSKQTLRDWRPLSYSSRFPYQ